MAEVVLSLKFPDEDAISLVLESGGSISGGVEMHLEMNQLLKSHIGSPFSIKGETRMSMALLEKIDTYKKSTWNDNKVATLLHKVVNGTEVIASRFFKKAIFTTINTLGSFERGGKVMVEIELELLGEEGYSITENSL